MPLEIIAPGTIMLADARVDRRRVAARPASREFFAHEQETVASPHWRVGLVPVIRTSSAADARFAVEEVAQGGIPIIEVTMTVPGAIDVIREIVKKRSRR